eukprot:5193291-Amphidinium_carterae.1
MGWPEYNTTASCEDVVALCDETIAWLVPQTKLRLATETRISRVNNNGDELAWLELLMLPKCCWGPGYVVASGGSEGERAELCPALQAKRKRPQQQREDDLGIRMARAQELLQEGIQQKACAALAPGKVIQEVT